ncbi:hypothetical protein SAMN05444166_5845 [Singulisphaera sp. GP187]|uniref:hypothetical protein n=1 Tax=Singulisphaera sp. GP187 TaxID=1882752 RepID=UPI000929A82E|nr:hypothetical protein [Singulisphaera sp. GP187]SIO58880.1 hypothetical protein SAMN05444166_5845 [Singulisphaera sp. GP187]
MPTSARSARLKSILGRSAMVILVTILGLIGGLAVGGYRAMTVVNTLPPAPGTMGFESAGFAPFVIFAIDLAVGAVGGAIFGLLIGVAGAILWPRRSSPGK